MALTLRATQPAPACSEHELVAAVRRGDDGAFSELYLRYQTRIGSYVFGMVGDHGRAEDIAQEVFISALRRMRENGRPIAFKPWIYEIAKNACIDEFRRTRRTREVSLDHDEASESPSLVLASGQTPDVAVESKQRLEDLRGAFHGLSESHHKIIVMRELEGLSYSEIAQRMGMSRPMVESTLFRARRRLSEEYEELVSGRRCEHVKTVIDRCDARTVRSLGIRERRQIARHLAHCQPCRRHARIAGFDESKLHSGRAGKLAALLPLPWLRARRAEAGGQDETFSDTATAFSHRLIALPSLQTLAAKIGDPGTAAPAGLGRAAATAAAIMLAGVGGGIASRIAANAASSGSSVGAAHVRSVSSGTAGAGGASSSISLFGGAGSAAGGSKPVGASAHPTSAGGAGASGNGASGRTWTEDTEYARLISRSAEPGHQSFLDGDHHSVDTVSQRAGSALGAARERTLCARRSRSSRQAESAGGLRDARRSRAAEAACTASGAATAKDPRPANRRLERSVPSAAASGAVGETAQRGGRCRVCCRRAAAARLRPPALGRHACGLLGGSGRGAAW